ncbi:MAG: YfbU family protein [Alphaproteobacteria bacterium]|nr:YfbU family protein [Alphaproteobacteria bacterium]
MPSERFEMRIDSELLERLDRWRGAEDDRPSRAEAIRRLVEGGLAHDAEGRPPHLSDGEKLIALMLADLVRKLEVEPEIDVGLLEKVIYGGHYWALRRAWPGIFHGHADSQRRVRLVVDVLQMWSILQDSFEALDEAGRRRVGAAAPLAAEGVVFPGFDGNYESEYLGIAEFLLRDLKHFGRLGARTPGLNSHWPMLDAYRAMLNVFEPLAKTLHGKPLTPPQLTAILQACKP